MSTSAASSVAQSNFVLKSKNTTQWNTDDMMSIQDAFRFYQNGVITMGELIYVLGCYLAEQNTTATLEIAGTIARATAYQDDVKGAIKTFDLMMEVIQSGEIDVSDEGEVGIYKIMSEAINAAQNDTGSEKLQELGQAFIDQFQDYKDSNGNVPFVQASILGWPSGSKDAAGAAKADKIVSEMWGEWSRDINEKAKDLAGTEIQNFSGYTAEYKWVDKDGEEFIEDVDSYSIGYDSLKKIRDGLEKASGGSSLNEEKSLELQKQQTIYDSILNFMKTGIRNQGDIFAQLNR